MISHGHEAELKCDNPDCEHLDEWEMYLYIGDTYGDCVRRARADGWRVAHDKSKCLCPGCVSEGMKLRDIDGD